VCLHPHHSHEFPRSRLIPQYSPHSPQSVFPPHARLTASLGGDAAGTTPRRKRCGTQSEGVVTNQRDEFQGDRGHQRQSPRPIRREPTRAPPPRHRWRAVTAPRYGRHTRGAMTNNRAAACPGSRRPIWPQGGASGVSPPPRGQNCTSRQSCSRLVTCSACTGLSCGRDSLRGLH